MNAKEIVDLFDTILGTEIAHLEVERAKLQELQQAGAKCSGLNALDAVIAAKKATRKALPKVR